jgi:hypothetical protein
VGYAVVKFPAGSGVVKVKSAVGRIVWVEGEAEQPLLRAPGSDFGCDVEERGSVHSPLRQLDNADLSRPLHNKEPPRIARRGGEEKWLIESARDADSI